MNKDIKVEFHCHTNASDGKFSPEDVVKRAKKNGVSILAITDHDTVDGLDRAINFGNELGIKIIPGIELSTIHNGESIHILGYFKDGSYKNKDFLKFLKTIAISREERGKKIVENLKKYYDIDISYDKVLEKGDGVVARPHIASTIIEAGYNYSYDYIFEKFISKDSKAYVPNKKISIEDGISILKKYNAIVILAHPKLIKNSTIDEILKYDFDGLEAIYFRNFKKETDKFLSIAHYKDLLVTCGSDFHGIINDSNHGDIGCMNLPLNHLERFLDFFE